MTLMVRILLLSAAVFAALRVGLYVRYADYFAEASLWRALLSGSRFDLKLIVLAMSPCLLLLLLPLPQRIAPILRRFAAGLAGVILLVLLGIGIADLAYFGELHRHIGNELALIGGDTQELWQTAWSSRLGDTLGGIVAVCVLAVVWYKWVIMPAGKPRSGSLKIQSVYAVLTLIVLVFLARGMVIKGKPLDSIDAFNGNGQIQANLTLNGVLTALQAFGDKANQTPLRYLDASTMTAMTQQQPQPFTHQPQPQFSDKKRNIVFILLESWSYRYIDALSGSHYGVTPNMDALVAQSQVWDNFYAAGQRSIIGIQAALTSVPALPNRPTLGFGLEMNNMSRIAQLASESGYRTLMVQSSNRRSFHMDGIAQALGFQEYYGKEDVPLLRNYPQDTPAYGWDYDTLMFLQKQINQQPEKPFFAFLFTGTTHEPFADAGEPFRRYPVEQKGENGFLNTLHYGDWAIGQFMQAAAKQSWYADTIFVFTADHTLANSVQGDDIKARFHIPLIVFMPNGMPARHANLASQYDLLPTFADWLGVQKPVATFGQSLLQTRQELPIMLNQGNHVAAVLPDGETVSFTEQNVLSGSPNHDLKPIQWRIQYADELLRANQWATP